MVEYFAVGIFSLFIGWIAGRASAYALLEKAKRLLEDVDKAMAELKEVADAIGRRDPGTDLSDIPGSCGRIHHSDPQREADRSEKRRS